MNLAQRSRIAVAQFHLLFGQEDNIFLTRAIANTFQLINPYEFNSAWLILSNQPTGSRGPHIATSDDSRAWLLHTAYTFLLPLRIAHSIRLALCTTPQLWGKPDT